MLKQYELKVPQNISVYYFNNKNMLLIKSNEKKKLIRLKLKLAVQPKRIIILPEHVNCNVKINKHSIKALQGNICSNINNSFVEITSNFYKKLKITGVGYKVFLIQSGNLKIIHLKLGFSHSIYIKIPKDISVKFFKTKKLVLSCKNLLKLTSLISIIRNCKKPDSYKAKGISFDTEKIKLKIGKIV